MANVGQRLVGSCWSDLGTGHPTMGCLRGRFTHRKVPRVPPPTNSGTPTLDDHRRPLRAKGAHRCGCRPRGTRHLTGRTAGQPTLPPLSFSSREPCGPRDEGSSRPKARGRGLIPHGVEEEHRRFLGHRAPRSRTGRPPLPWPRPRRGPGHRLLPAGQARPAGSGVVVLFRRGTCQGRTARAAPSTSRYPSHQGSQL